MKKHRKFLQEVASAFNQVYGRKPDALKTERKKVFEEAIPNLVRTNLDITGIRSGQYLMVVNGNLRRKITFE
jgi:hypothetical protein